MRYPLVPLLAACLGFCWVSRTSAQENWPQFRGERSSGVAETAKLPERWGPAENVAWKTELPGTGWSSPIVWGDKVFLTSAVAEKKVAPPRKGLYIENVLGRTAEGEHRWMVYCLDFRSGKILWERVAHRGVPPGAVHVKNSYASETPVTDGQLVVAYFGNVGLSCHDTSGRELWSQKWGSFPTRFGWGPAASPLLYQDRVYVVNDNDKDSFLVALDKRTGREVWRVRRDEKSNWATPFLWHNGRRAEIVTAGTGKVRSYDLEGRLLWELRGMSSIAIPTPVALGDLVYISSGYVGDRKRPIFAVRPGASGDVTLKDDQTGGPAIAWCQPSGGPYNPSPVAYRDHLYVLYDRGELSCYDARTGEIVYSRQRLASGAGAFTASPWACDGKIYCLSEDGETFVVQAGGQFKLLGRNRLDEMTLATPAIARDSLVVRTFSKVYRIARQ